MTRATGLFVLEGWDARGRRRWRVRFRNGATTAGRDYLQDAGFRGQAQLSAWYLGLIDATGYSALAPADTAAAHAGWSEATDYSGSRPAWTVAASAGGILTNTASPAVFTATGAMTLRGAFLVSDATRGGSSGTLYSTGAFDVSQAVAAGDTLTLTYVHKLTASN